MMNKKEILKQYFGFDSFREIQEQAIEHILQKQDLLTILPTGSGKSLIFQLPTLMMDGVTIVISPLIALMKDQVMALSENGISASMISSGNSNEDNDNTFKRLYNNELKFLYVAPERFTNEYFISRIQNLNINFFVIDEAHCVSEWGHEFRDDYQKLKYLKTNFPNIPITCFTATATKSVEADILQTLAINPTNVLRSKIQRTNLIIRAQKRLGNGQNQIISFLKTHKDECGIVYCFTRKETQKTSDILNKQGFKTIAYHAGLSSEIRDDVFIKFKNEDIKIIVATIAFGMGIDKGNIRFVLHTSMPKTLENYAQEIGRAGRDGLNADVLLLYSKADEIAKRKFIDELPNSNYKSSNYQKIEQMYRFCISSKCRHKYIANYFNDEIEECNDICDNCLEDEKEFQDITIEAQKLISTIIRCEERFGQGYIIDILRGSKAKRILDFGHDKLSVYGIGEELSKEQWGSVVDTLLDIEAIIIDPEFRVLKLTSIAKEVLTKKKNVLIDKKDLIQDKSYSQYKQDIVVNETYESFRILRTKIAKEANVPAYLVFPDKTLIEISNKLPSSGDEFLAISGVGALKLEKYGKDFLDLCESLKQNGATPIKVLSKTYIQTSELINEGKNIDEIASERELQQSTIISHVFALYENKYINDDSKDSLIEPIKKDFPEDIKKWIEIGLETNNVDELKQFIATYKNIF